MKYAELPPEAVSILQRAANESRNYTNEVKRESIFRQAEYTVVKQWPQYFQTSHVTAVLERKQR
jgi:hypothetical protein